MALKTANYWLTSAEDESDIEHIFCLDYSDQKSSTYHIIDRYVLADNDCVVQAVNRGAEIAKGDILVYLSDDFRCPNGWDRIIRTNIPNPSERVMLKFDDGVQHMDTTVLTVPVMSRGLYNHLGYFFNPLYKSQWVDVDLYFETRDFMKKIDVVFKHHHYSVMKQQPDETNRRNDANWQQGKEVWENRKKQNGWKEQWRQR